MKKISLNFQAFLSSLGVLIYVSLVAWLMFNAENIFGKMTGFYGPLSFLLLFVFSALVVGLIIFGRPIYLIIDGRKKEAVKLVLLNVFCLLILLILVFSLIFLTK